MFFVRSASQFVDASRALFSLDARFIHALDRGHLFLFRFRAPLRRSFAVFPANVCSFFIDRLDFVAMRSMSALRLHVPCSREAIATFSSVRRLRSSSLAVSRSFLIALLPRSMFAVHVLFRSELVQLRFSSLSEFSVSSVPARCGIFCRGACRCKLLIDRYEFAGKLFQRA